MTSDLLTADRTLLHLSRIIFSSIKFLVSEPSPDDCKTESTTKNDKSVTDTDKRDDVTTTAKTDTPDVTTTPSSDETTNVNPDTEPTETQSLRNPKKKKNVSFTTTYLLNFVFVTLNRPLINTIYPRGTNCKNAVVKSLSMSVLYLLCFHVAGRTSRAPGAKRHTCP